VEEASADIANGDLDSSESQAAWVESRAGDSTKKLIGGALVCTLKRRESIASEGLICVNRGPKQGQGWETSSRSIGLKGFTKEEDLAKLPAKKR